MIKSANPALTLNIFKNEMSSSQSDTMTIQGTVNKTAIMLCLVVVSASIVWNQYFNGIMPTGLLTIGVIGGFITSLITIFKKKTAHITAPLYAVFQGLFLGGVSAMFEASYPGIVIQAVGLTFGTLFCLLGAYKSKLIEPTENFKLGVAAATGGIFFLYMINFLLSIFGINLGFFTGNGLMSIGLSVFVVVIAALNLVMDFDFIESGEEMGAPKYMEWYSAFGLMVTLIWLYMEILRLLVKLQSRRD
ncbi:hypothetical protein DID78_02945 [Candidatus Marinamargulisbacteria bacterium SCGC AG-343-D04]|nr:hypothetical protein DID78_02945 [Candidatus Marinamargulisbacteria bacterium SCGC AG-343-D04]